MGVIAWVAKKAGLLVVEQFVWDSFKDAHEQVAKLREDLDRFKLALKEGDEEYSKLHREWQMTKDELAQTRGRFVGEVQTNDDLRARLTEAEHELREIRKGLMVRMGILPKADNTVDPPAPHAPINKRRAPWDRQRAELEADSKEKMDHWTKKIEEVEKKDKVREAMAEPPVANGIAEPENE